MRSWTADSHASDMRLSIATIESLTRSLGTPGCARAMLAALNEFVTVDHCALLIRQRSNDLRLLANASRVSELDAARAALHYIREMHVYDPGEDIAIAVRETGEGSIRLRYRTRDEVVSARYRSACYEGTGIEDRLTISSLHSGGTETLFRCYRHQSTGRFTAAELELLTRVAPFFLAFAEAHAKFTVPHNIPIVRWRESLDQSTGAALSSRELDVCSNLLSGLTLADTGEKLGISINTAITYSRRAYAKLGVESIRELHDKLIRASETATTV